MLDTKIEQERLTVVVADDDPLVRRVLRGTLEANGFDVVGEAASGREAVAQALQRRPDLLVLDLVMPGGDGIDVIRRVRNGGLRTPIVVLTACGDDEQAVTALRAGADGFLSKDFALDELPRTLQKVVAGEAAISRRLSRSLIERLRVIPDGQIGVRPVRSPLTSREWEVYDQLCARRTTDEIATELFLSIETVRSHVKSILRKLHVGTRAEAVAMAPRLRAPAD